MKTMLEYCKECTRLSGLLSNGLCPNCRESTIQSCLQKLRGLKNDQSGLDKEITLIVELNPEIIDQIVKSLKESGDLDDDMIADIIEIKRM